jgi:hypothetical protein
MTPMPKPEPTPPDLRKLPPMPTLDDLVDERLGAVGGQISHTQTIESLQKSILTKLGIDKPCITSELVSMLWALKVRQLAGLIREKERDIVARAMETTLKDGTPGTYDSANLEIVQNGGHGRLDAHITTIQSAIITHEHQLQDLNV